MCARLLAVLTALAVAFAFGVVQPAAQPAGQAATLYDRSADGTDRRIGQFAINPELRDGLDKVSLVTRGQRYDMTPPGFPMAHHLRPGHRLVLRVSTAEGDKIPMFSEDPNVTVFTGPGATEVTLPTVPASRLVADNVPFKR